MKHLDFIIAYEKKHASDQEIVEGFQAMIDDGTVWKLQGAYGRTAQDLINLGHCTPAVTPVPAK